MIPINLNDNHWILNVIDLKHKKIGYFDSLPIYCEKTGSIIMLNIAKFFDDFQSSIKSNDNQNLNLNVDMTTDRIDEDTTNTNKVIFRIIQGKIYL